MTTPSDTPPGVRLVQIDPEQAGQRIDNYLLNHLKGVPRSRIYRILRRGEVRVNRGRVSPEYRLQAGDQVRIPPVRTAPAAPGPAAGAPGVRGLEAAILYEDDRLIVLNKPSGLAVHGGSGLSHGVIEALRALRPAAPYLELVHRLDRETSGCLLIAKRRSELRSLHDLLRTGGIDKRYLALVRGAWRGGPRKVAVALRKNQMRGGERMVMVDDAGKPSSTMFRPLQVFQDATLVEAELHTGRTHQIRVHAAHIGHPLAGDDKYGDADFNRALRERGLRRLFLHAHALSFRDPASGRELQVSAPLGEDLKRVLDGLEARPPAARE